MRKSISFALTGAAAVAAACTLAAPAAAAPHGSSGSLGSIADIPGFGSLAPGGSGEKSITFVRHGESYGNVSGYLHTDAPGPYLTDKGVEQAQAAAQKLAAEGYDCVFSSNLARTQQTAEPTAELLDLPVRVLPGLREIEGGAYESMAMEDPENHYVDVLMAWIMAGDLDAAVPGGESGHEFMDRTGAAVQTIYDSGCEKSVAFAHGGMIMAWAANGTDNFDRNMVIEHPLDNTDEVRVTGSPGDWSITEWNGVPAAAAPVAG
ncbi:histidine phosphatase family protein [Tomitella fengzijianii]|uniref:Histidine phosphatase family protein n=1 Tax=Tomitella fengzijianii TaxID=2597660 RepID=A0A516WZN8_9ACTN|nr:histidine phosphatase family protein [Tomitella fengzijianii]QDQ96265.1 histidine phosphatase family protein [Tomitella fengzijianii]